MWNAEHWGDLSYRWFVEKDFAYRERSNRPQIIGYMEVDTTESWGSCWNPIIENNVDWWSGYWNFNGYMRLLVASEITNNKGGYGLQINKSFEDGTIESLYKQWHKVIFGTTWNYSGWDIIDWASSHIGTPYAISDRRQTFLKRPYQWLDCSGLVVAARIQDIGPEWNNNYILDMINVQTLVDGSYSYDGHVYDTETTQIDPSEAHTNCAVALKKGTPNWTHIGLVTVYRYSNIRRQIIECRIIHARGALRYPHRRVRYDDCLNTYLWNGYEAQFLEFED
jgi:hypothetical protein